jgi:serine/threonine protein kinase
MVQPVADSRVVFVDNDPSRCMANPSLDAPEDIDLVGSNLRSLERQDGSGLLKAGTVVCSRYEVLHHVGSGSVGIVVAAKHVGFAESVALKFLRPECASRETTAQNFLREGRQAFRLRSEHIARVYDADTHEGLPFLVVEDLDGINLRSWLQRAEQTDAPRAVDCVLQICEALACAHALGIVHRNLKPENVFLLGGEHIKVSDFGLSRSALDCDETDGRKSSTRLAAMSSSSSHDAPYYLAPEQIRERAQPDARADIWSVGCMLYELLTGQTPFDRGGVLQTCVAVLEQEPAHLTDLRADLSEGLCTVVLRCLHKDPAKRFADVGELAQALLPFGSGRYNSYAERCRAQLGTDTASAKPGQSAPHAANQTAEQIAPASAAQVTPVVDAEPLPPESLPTQPDDAVSVQQTMVLGQPAPAATPLELLQYRSKGRMETLAFDPSALFGPERDEPTKPEPRVVTSHLPTEPTVIVAVQTQPIVNVGARSSVKVAAHAPDPDEIAMASRNWRAAGRARASSLVLFTALMCLLGGGIMLLVNVERKQPEQPKLLHLVTPREQAPRPHDVTRESTQREHRGSE